MTKIDFKKEWKHLYQPPSDEFVVVDVPQMQFLMIDGEGDPNQAQAYTDAVEALFGLAFKVKFWSKKELENDYVVPPLEGLWWADDMEVFTVGRDKSAWKWTMMIMQPEWVTRDAVERAREQAGKSRNLPSLSAVRLEEFFEGRCVQILHAGSYDDEGPTIKRMHDEFMPARGFTPSGKHHEIYLSDPRRVAPEKLKTILRQPVK